METVTPIAGDVQDIHELDEIELTDQDILDAMRHIQGYLDVSTEDFRQIYRLAHASAVDQLLGGIGTASLLRHDMTPLTADLTMNQAAARIVQSGYKGLPVVDAEQRVIGILTEADFLRRLKAASFLELMLRLLADPSSFTHRCHATRVAEAMTAPAVTIPISATFSDVLSAFTHHPGRSLPVVDPQGHCAGMVLHKDFLVALHRQACAGAEVELAG